MSDHAKAVFLSYASQDAEAAKRIADALRGAGVEVWFDAEGGLEHGDEWDAKIRRQIKECVLFIPVVSAHTEERDEGYFRLEWDLAAERARTIASGVAFILPVVIDGTKEQEALVPDRFRSVQWTKLPGGHVPFEVLQRFLKLWSHRTGALKQRRGESDTGEAALPLHDSDKSGHDSPSMNGRRGLKRRWWTLPAFGAALAALLLFWASGRLAQETPKKVSVVHEQPVLTETQQALVQIAAVVDKDADATRDEWALAETLGARAVSLEPANSEAWAAYADAALGLYIFYQDLARNPVDDAVKRAQRAASLAPHGDVAQLSLARCYAARAETRGEAEQMLRALLSRRPQDGRVLRALAGLLVRELKPSPSTPGTNERLAEVILLYDRGTAMRDAAPHAWREKAWLLAALGRMVEADAAIERSLALRPGPAALAMKISALLYVHDKLDQACALLEKTPGSYYRHEAVCEVAARAWLWKREPERCLRMLNGWNEEFLWAVPKGFIAGQALQMLQRPEAARLAWQAGLGAVEKQIVASPRQLPQTTFLYWKARLLACLGDKVAAGDAMQVWEEVRGRGRVDRSALLLALGRTDEALDALPSQLSTGPSKDLVVMRWQTALGELQHDPTWDPLRGYPRFEALLATAARSLPEESNQNDLRPEPLANATHKSVAVLAFANLSDDKANEYFSDGISEELLNVLAKIPGLKVSARTSAFHFKGKDTPIPEIARQLGVAYVVEGSVRKAGNQVRITAQLIKAADGFHVWSETFTRNLMDVFAVQDEIAGLIAKSLQLRLAVGAKASVNPEAFELYMQARQALNQRDAEGFARAEALLTRAIELDPGLVRAHAALADVWTLSANLRQEIGFFGQRESPLFVRIEREIELALALDPDSAEARASLGFVRLLEWKPADAERELRRAVALNPNYPQGHHWLGSCLTNTGAIDEGLAEYRRAIELDPLSFRILDNYGDALNAAGRSEEALAVINRSLELQPKSAQTLQNKLQTLLALNRLAEAEIIMRKLPEDTGRFYFGRLGLKAEAEAALAKSRGRDRAALLLALDRFDEWLDAVSASDIYLIAIRETLFSRKVDSIRTDPRFKKLIATLGLMEAQARVQAWREAQPPENQEAKK